MRIHGWGIAATAGWIAVGWGGLAGAQSTVRVSVDSAGVQGDEFCEWSAISADGRFVTFTSLAANLVPGDTNGTSDVFVHDRETGTTERVSVDSAEAEGDGASVIARLSADGRFAVFASDATNLVAGDTNGCRDVFVRDRLAGTTERVSVRSDGTQGSAESDFYYESISADGRFVGFHSLAADLVDGDTNGVMDVFVHDRATGATERVSVDSAGMQGNDRSYGTSLSADGRFAAFFSIASNLVAGDSNFEFDVFVRDRMLGVTERVSVGAGAVEANGQSSGCSLSADGGAVTFMSKASNLVPGDTNGSEEVFVRNRVDGTTVRASVSSTGEQGNSEAYRPMISADGRYVAYYSWSDNLVPGDTNGAADVFVHDLLTRETTRESVGDAGAQANSASWDPGISADGRIVVFASWADNLVANDTNGWADVFVRNRHAVAAWTNYGDGFPGTYGIPQLTARAAPVLGGPLTLDLTNSHGNFSLALLFVGFDSAKLKTNRGGQFLLVPSFSIYVALVPYGPTAIDGWVDADEALCGLHVYAQAVEFDDGAAKAVSFTPGIDLLLGH